MRLDYMGDVDVKLTQEDLGRIVSGGKISGEAVGVYSKRHIVVNVFASDDKFYCSGGVGEGFSSGYFQGWVLERPKEMIQLAFPWGKEVRQVDYSTLNIRMSRPVLVGLLESEQARKESGGYFCGIARGISSGHVIDRLNLSFFIPQ